MEDTVHLWRTRAIDALRPATTDSRFQIASGRVMQTLADLPAGLDPPVLPGKFFRPLLYLAACPHDLDSERARDDVAIMTAVELSHLATRTAHDDKTGLRFNARSVLLTFEAATASCGISDTSVRSRILTAFRTELEALDAVVGDPRRTALIEATLASASPRDRVRSAGLGQLGRGIGLAMDYIDGALAGPSRADELGQGDGLGTTITLLHECLAQVQQLPVELNQFSRALLGALESLDVN